MTLPEAYQDDIEVFLASESADKLQDSVQAKYLITPERLFSLNSEGPWYNIDP
jgi:ATP-dependent helicase HepA